MPFTLNRNEKGFQNVKNTRCDRSILVFKTPHARAVILASQPSDCLLLQKDHIQCASIDVLIVRFDEPSTYTINGPAHPETLEDWQNAIQHLLSTYQPQRAYVHFDDLRPPGVLTVFTLDVREVGTYCGLLLGNQDVLVLFR